MRSDQIEFLFNLSTVARSEKVLTAELHLFKLRPQASLTFNRHHFCQVRPPEIIILLEEIRIRSALTAGVPGLSLLRQLKLKAVFCLCLQVSVYQVVDSSRMNISQSKKLVSSRLIPIHSNGWEVFTITQAVSL